MKIPTCAEIAVACHLSASTVSRALNNSHLIPDETRERVIKIATEMGWKPNPLTSAYMAHLRSTRPTTFKAVLALISDFPLPNGADDLPGHDLLTYRGFKRRATEYGYSVKVFSLAGDDVTPETLDRTLNDWNIPGIMLTSMRVPGKVLTGITWSRYAIVALGYSMKAPNVHRVVGNVPMGVKEAIEQSFGLGYQRIGIAVSEEYDIRTKHGVMFPASYMATRLKPGQSIDTFIYRESDPHFHDAIKEWLKRTKPEIVMGMFDDWVFDDLGWRVPKDIAKVTFDHSWGYPAHAGLDLRYEDLGALAADVLISEVVLNRRGLPANPVDFSTPVKWINAASAPPVSKRRRRHA